MLKWVMAWNGNWTEIDLNLCPMCGRLGLENPSSISRYYLILCLKIFLCKMSIVISSQQYFKLYEIIYWKYQNAIEINYKQSKLKDLYVTEYPTASKKNVECPYEPIHCYIYNHLINICVCVCIHLYIH